MDGAARGVAGALERVCPTAAHVNALFDSVDSRRDGWCATGSRDQGGCVQFLQQHGLLWPRAHNRWRERTGRGYLVGSDEDFELLHVVPHAFNRAAIYSAKQLHNGHITPAAESALTCE